MIRPGHYAPDTVRNTHALTYCTLSVFCKFFPVNAISSFPHLKAAVMAAEKKKDTEQTEKNTSEPLTLRLRTKNKMKVFDLMNGDGACYGDGANNMEETVEVCLKGQLYEILGLLKQDV
jgi:hypothetical protein